MTAEPGTPSRAHWRQPADAVPPELIEHYRQLQQELAARVEEVPLEREPRTVAAVDVHLRGEQGVAAIVVMRYPELEVVEERWAEQPIDFPYIPGFLSFREAPVCLAALAVLQTPPELLLVDGQGRAHPRRFGIACHLGVETGIPAIGVAKSVLTGRYGELDEARGSTAPLVSRKEVVGTAVRSRDGVSPLIVSVGNRITLEEAVAWTLRTVTRYRLPEPSRRAHRLAKELVAGTK
jgi:deoxyribonuclease V